MPMTKPASATSPTVSQVSAVTFCSNGSSSGMRAVNPITNGRLHLSRHFFSRDWLTGETHVEITAGEKKGAAMTGALASTPGQNQALGAGVKSYECGSSKG